MTLKKKHYLFAEEVVRAAPEGKKHDIAEAFVQLFTRDRDSFDRARFLIGCGLQ